MLRTIKLTSKELRQHCGTHSPEPGDHFLGFKVISVSGKRNLDGKRIESWLITLDLNDTDADRVCDLFFTFTVCEGLDYFTPRESMIIEDLQTAWTMTFAKWYLIAKGYRPTSPAGTCGLCQKFMFEVERHSQCIECPIVNVTKAVKCFGMPFDMCYCEGSFGSDSQTGLDITTLQILELYHVFCVTQKEVKN